MPQHVERPPEVHLDHALEGIPGVRAGRARDLLGPADSRAAHRDAQLAVAGGRLHGRCDRLAVRHIADHRFGAELPCNRERAVGVDVGDRHVRAALRECPCRRLAEARASADDQCPGTFDPHGGDASRPAGQRQREEPVGVGHPRAGSRPAWARSSATRRG